jgi:hypothetical protein
MLRRLFKLPAAKPCMAAAAALVALALAFFAYPPGAAGDRMPEGASAVFAQPGQDAALSPPGEASASRTAGAAEGEADAASSAGADAAIVDGKASPGGQDGAAAAQSPGAAAASAQGGAGAQAQGAGAGAQAADATKGEGGSAGGKEAGTSGAAGASGAGGVAGTAGTSGTAGTAGASQAQPPSPDSPSSKPDAATSGKDGAGGPGGNAPTCTISISCHAVLSNLGRLDKAKLGIVPANGVILAAQTVSLTEGESAFDVLRRVTAQKQIHLEFVSTPLYNAAYIEGIGNLYEFDAGPLSGWMYRVNGWFPSYGASQYAVASGDVIEFVYSCDLGADIGAGAATGQLSH